MSRISSNIKDIASANGNPDAAISIRNLEAGLDHVDQAPPRTPLLSKRSDIPIPLYIKKGAMLLKDVSYPAGGRSLESAPIEPLRSTKCTVSTTLMTIQSLETPAEVIPAKDLCLDTAVDATSDISSSDGIFVRKYLHSLHDLAQSAMEPEVANPELESDAVEKEVLSDQPLELDPGLAPQLSDQQADKGQEPDATPTKLPRETTHLDQSEYSELISGLSPKLYHEKLLVSNPSSRI